MTAISPPQSGNIQKSHLEKEILPKKRTFRFNHKVGPMVFDLWEPVIKSEAPPIVLIHGWGGSGSYWESTAKALSETVPVYVPDLLGTGRSQPIQKTNNMYDQVNSLVDWLNKLGLERIQIVGHSMGGAMSLLLADAWPGQVERVVITSMCFFVNQEQVKLYRAIMKGMQLMMRFRAPWMVNLPGLSNFLAARYFYRIPDDPQLLRLGLLDYLGLDFDTAVACAGNAADQSIIEAGKKLQSPTLLVACRQDQVMPIENVNYSVEQIPDCEVRWIDHCGHLPMVEKPDVYMKILRDFLQL